MTWLKRGTLFVLGIASGFFFLLYSYLVSKDIFRSFDFDLTVKLQDNLSRGWDSIFSLLSDVGSFEFVLIFVLIVLVFLRKLRGIIVLGFFALFHVVELFGKALLPQLPPPQFMIRTEHWMDFPQFHVRQEFSYPSGHAGRNAFITVVLLFFILRSKRLSVPLKIILIGVIAVFDIAMLLSRVYLGEHWTTDVIGGVLLGLSLALISVAVY